MTATYDSLAEAWVEELHKVRRDGELSSPRGMETVERRWKGFAITNPLTFPMDVVGREFAHVIGALEALSLVGQFSVPELFTDRVAKFKEFTDAGVFHGSYGARVAGRLGDLVDLLRRDPDTRQAVLTIYDSRSDLGASKRDIPCTLSLHFMRRGQTLEMKVTMRSNDIWLGTPYDLVQFAVLQASIAQALGLRPGLYVHAAGSQHMYLRDSAKADRVAAYHVAPPEMDFPLWAIVSPTVGCDIGEISARARDIALNRAAPLTQFEHWCHDLVWPRGAWYPGQAR